MPTSRKKDDLLKRRAGHLSDSLLLCERPGARIIRLRMSHHTINVTTGVRAAIESHALSEHPFECCGLLSGNGNLISTAHALRNEAERRESRYFASPEDLFAAMRRIRAAGQQLLGIYHSHPRTVAYPSSADVETAFYPEAIYFIISLVPQIELRAFEIKEAQIREVLISTID